MSRVDMVEFALLVLITIAILAVHVWRVRIKEQKSRLAESLLADRGHREKVLLYYASIRGVAEYKELVSHLREFLGDSGILAPPWTIEVQNMDGRSPFFLISSTDYEDLKSERTLPEMSEQIVEIYEGGQGIAIVKIKLAQPMDEGEILSLYSVASVVYYTAVKAKNTTRDSLTGLCTGAHFYHLLEAELERSKRYQHSLSVIFMDMDGFKAINDNFGHKEGDKVLQEIASILEEHHREPDTLARRSGDEFLILLPETDGESCLVVAETLREAIAKHTFTGPNGEESFLTASVGVTSFPETGTTQEELLRVADEAMYEAKGRGGNRVVFNT